LRSVCHSGSPRALSSNLLQPGSYFARVFAANLAGYGEPSVYPVTALATPIVPVAWDDTLTPAEGSVQSIQVGYLLRLTIRAHDGDIPFLKSQSTRKRLKIQPYSPEIGRAAAGCTTPRLPRLVRVFECMRTKFGGP